MADNQKAHIRLNTQLQRIITLWAHETNRLTLQGLFKTSE